VPGQLPAGEPRRFPLLDDEPPPRPWWQRLLIPAAVIAAAGVVWTAVALWPASAPPPRPAASQARRLAGLAGRIVAVDPDQDLVVSDPDGSKVVPLKALGNVGYTVYPALDNRYLSLGNGQVVATSPPREPTLASTKTSLFTADQFGAVNEPFADHDRDLVVLASQYGYTDASDATVSDSSLATGRSVTLGVAHQVAGDPQTLGAFVSVAAPLAPTTSTTDVTPDLRVELREAGRPRRVLATAAAINRALGQDPRLAVGLTPYPNPSGTQIAVTVQAQSGGGTSGVVILNRAGRVVGTVATPKGPAGADAVSWSPAGTALAFISAGPAGAVLSVWSHGQLRTVPLPASAKDNYCLWSPDGKTLLCTGGQEGAQHWLFANVSRGALTTGTGPGLPVAWLP
jgi:hypothetical protein